IGNVTASLRTIHHERHGIPLDRMVEIPNGAWLPPLAIEPGLERRRALGIPDATFLAGYAGNLSHWHDLRSVFTALGSPELASVRLWIAGDGSAREPLEAAVRKAGLEGRILFLGPRPEEEVAALAMGTQVLLAPYRPSSFRTLYGDPVPTLKVLFGMACDRPILANAAPLVAELGAGESISSMPAQPPPDVEPNPDADPDAEPWRIALRRWLDRWKDAGAPLRDWPWPCGEGPGRRYVESERTWDHTAGAWERAMLRVIASRSR
ncbi:MAG: glycosyltransferase, partial [Candidatus Eisenbacteria bacterium]|nr:glycosyltransferase [Candidatus Eisenbacteria bacterium]